MTVHHVLEDTQRFLEHLGLGEEPFGVYYADSLPDNEDLFLCHGQYPAGAEKGLRRLHFQGRVRLLWRRVLLRPVETASPVH